MTSEFCTSTSGVGFAVTVMSASDSKYVLLLSMSTFSALLKLLSSRVPLRLLNHLSAMFMHFEKEKETNTLLQFLSHTYWVVFYLGRSGRFGGWFFRLARLVGLLLHWVLLRYSVLLPSCLVPPDSSVVELDRICSFLCPHRLSVLALLPLMLKFHSR